MSQEIARENETSKAVYKTEAIHIQSTWQDPENSEHWIPCECHQKTTK